MSRCWIGLLTVGGLFLSACNCSPNPPPPDAGEDAGVDAGPADAGDAGSDAGFDAGFRCRIDDDCAVFEQGLRCDDRTGECIPAKGCNLSSDCSSQDPDDYCYVYGRQCRCVTETNDAGFSGICRRRRGVCEVCTDDSQCGIEPNHDPPGKCLTLRGDPSGKKYCFQAQSGSCPCGMIIDPANGVCVPAAITADGGLTPVASCEQVGCTEDRHCPSGTVCNKARCLCERRCRWNFDPSVMSDDCPPGTICWVDSASLDPNSLFYGSGRCKPPCNSNQECQDTSINPFGGPNLKCASEKLKGGGLSPKRCRANGECMDKFECPEQPPESVYLGYCDKASFQCKTDCRVGTDPATGKPFADCRFGYKCVADAGANQCVLAGCSELGGARVACNRGQYCCGDDRNFDGVPDPCPPVNEREPNGCFDAPKPPYCFTCSSHADCQNITLPAYWTNACSNGSKSLSCSPLPNLCLQAPPRPGTQQGITMCAPSTHNDTTNDGQGPRDARGCPAGWQVSDILPKFVNGDDYCSSDSDCNVGTDAGRCMQIQHNATRLQDGGYAKACVCNNPGQVSNCPNNPDAGITSVCKSGIATPTVCLQSVVCFPPWPLMYRDAGPPEYGCGL